MTFAELLAELYDDLLYQTTPAAAVVTRLKRRLNTAQQAVLAEPALASLLNVSLAFTSTASQARYGLSNVAEIRALESTTQRRRLFRRSESWYRTLTPDPTQMTGSPSFFVPIGHVATANVPATTGAGLWIVSSSASDTAGPTVTVDAVRVGGYSHSPAATALNGLTRVQLGAQTDYEDVTQFQLSAVCVGDVSLYDAAVSGNLLAVIPKGQTTSRYFGFYLSLTPSAAEVYTLEAEGEIQPLVNDDDEPRFPQKFHRLLGFHARMREYEAKDDDRYKIAVAGYVDLLTKLKAHVNSGGDPLIPGGALVGRSDLGPNYAPGTIWD